MPSPYPAADLPFAEFALAADRVIAPDPESFGVSLDLAAELHAAAESFDAKLAIVRSPYTRTPVAIVEKDDARRILRTLIQKVLRIVDAFPGTDDGMRQALGITDRRTGRAPKHAAPTSRPIARVTNTLGGYADVRLADQETPSRRTRPKGVMAAIVFTAITPADHGQPDFDAVGRFAAVATKSTIRLKLPSDAGGGLLWVQAKWISGTGGPGPAGVPTAARIVA